MKKKIIIHPLLVGFFPVLSLYVYNLSKLKVNISIIFVTLAIITSGVLITWFLLGFFLKDREKAGLVVSICIIWFFSYGHVHNLLLEYLLFGNQKYVISIWSLILFAAVFVLIRIQDRKKFANLTGLLNIISISLIGVCFASYIFYTLKTQPIVDNTRQFENKPSPQYLSISQKADKLSEKIHHKATKREIKKTSKPNIYYIILDSYPREDILKSIFSYDNYEFISYLRKKGFYIASQSTSNYAFTAVSLASSMNMEYLNFLAEKDEESSDFGVLGLMIKNNAVRRFLGSKGYTYLTLESGETIIPLGNYKYYTKATLIFVNEFNMLLLKNTVLKYFSTAIIGRFTRDKILSIFERIAEVPDMGVPVFLFAHVLSPHPPFVFGPDGERVNLVESAIGRVFPKKLFNDQVTFVNKKIISVIDTIFQKSNEEPVVVIQADHGAGYIFDSVMHTKFDPSDGFVKTQFGILNAYYFPKKDYSKLYHDITPVNTFRVIFDQYFGTGHGLLEDRNYYSTHKQPYKFTDVTQRVR